MKIHNIILLSLFLFCYTFILGQHTHLNRVAPTDVTHHHIESNSPIGLSGDHFHNANSFMFSYKYMSMNMSGLLNGHEDLSLADAHSSFMVAPTEMNMNMHMLGAMYAFTNRFTVMAMSSYKNNEMQLTMRNGNSFTTSSKGLSDISLSAIYAIKANETSSWHILAGVNIPAGDYQVTDDTPMEEGLTLAYPMQLGSGTIDPFFNTTFLLDIEKFCSGFQAKYLFRTSNNEADFSLGNELNLNIWTSYTLNQTWSLNSRINFKDLASIDGANPIYNIMMMPLFDATNSGRTIINTNIGVNFKPTIKDKHGLTVAVEAGIPVYDEANGIQMKNGFSMTAGIRYTLGNAHCH